MLMVLHIEDIAVIELADIEFQRGFNVLTGETGAGKSIVIDALSAVIGQRASRDLIRTGESKAVVSALFSGVESNSALAEQGIEPEEGGMVLLQREVQADGKNLCRINGRPVTVTQLRQVGMSLLNIHGQHDGQQLLDEQTHIRYLDAFGRIDAPMSVYQTCYAKLCEITGEIKALAVDEAEKERRIDSLQRQITELEKAGLKKGEEEELLSRRNILRNGEKYLSAVQGADFCLNGGENDGGALALVADAENALAGAKQLGEQFGELQNRLSALRRELYDIAETVRDMKDSYDFSETELDTAESRLDFLYRLKKKYGASVEEMLEYLQKAQLELDSIQSAGDTLARLEKSLAICRKETERAAHTLTIARQAAAKKLEKRILAELQDLAMKNVRFSIDFAEKELGTTGGDTVRFLMSANAGEDLRPIHKIASGGELARIMLALKNVLAENDSVGTLVFDEVDTGVSGRAAQKVAEKLAQVSRGKQVLCVTHLPQLAAMADVHFSVEKGESKNRTYTKVTCLDRARRREELARLTGGSHITETILSGAEELLTAAETFKKSLQ